MAGPSSRFAPLKPSKLRICSEPLSPVFPLTSSSCPKLSGSSPPLPVSVSIPENTTSYSTPPIFLLPAPWLWSCHHCKSTYELGITRRCLQCRHYFCGGFTRNPKTGRIKQHKACGSVFDYTAWSRYGEWRRKSNRQLESRLLLGVQDCTNYCDYPSQCHHIRRQNQNLMSAVSESALHKPDMPTGDSKDNTSSALPTRTETKPFERTRSRFKRLVKSAEKQTLSITTKDSKRERTSGREKAQSVPTSGINLPMLDFKAFSPNLEERDAVIDRKTSTSMRNNIEEDQAPGDIDNLDLDSEPTDTMLDIPLENTGSSPIPIQGGNKEFDNISIASLNVNEERTSLMSSSGTSLFDNFAVEYEGVFGELEMET